MKLTHELAVNLLAVEEEANSGNGSDVDVSCARAICQDTQQQALLEVCACVCVSVCVSECVCE